MTATTPQRPVAPTVVLAGIPAAIKVRTQWVIWRFVLKHRDERWTKVPFNPRDGSAGDTSDPGTWGTFAEALTGQRDHRGDGIGYVFSADDPYCGIDLDACFDERDVLTPRAAAIVADFDTTTERTPSSHGLHLLIEAVLPPTPPDGHTGRKSVTHKIELYDRLRFFTFTGQRLPGVPSDPQPRQPQLDALYRQLFPVVGVKTGTVTRPGTPPTTDDAELLERIVRSKSGFLFGQLWGGDTSAHGDDDSSADLALCNILAHWTHNDEDRIDRLFRRSGLMREKWERDDYRRRTIDKACAGRTWAEPNGQGFSANGSAPDEDEHTGPRPIDPNEYDRTDTGNANLFAALYGDELRFDHRRQHWFRWGGHWWREDDDAYAPHLTEQIGAVRIRAAGAIDDKGERKQALKWAYQSQSSRLRTALLNVAATTPGMKTNGSEWDTDRFRFGAMNGVIDLTTGALHDGDPRDHISRHSPLAYDPDARAPRWERFLREVFSGEDETIGWVQRFVGYSLTGDISEHALVLCFGEGSNGKSTFLDTLTYVLGDYAYSAPFSVFTKAERESGNTNDLASLMGRRFVTASEVNEGERLNEARMKALTGGDAITARFLRQEFFTFHPVLKLWLGVNHKPVVRDDSFGFWRRFRMLPFLARFEGSNEVKDLKQTLMLDEGAGILAWAVRGAVSWRRDGMATPASVSEATAAYRQDSDPLAEYIARCCVVGDQQRARGADLYGAYLDWATEEHLREREMLSQTMFGRRMGDRYKKTRAGNGVNYSGIGLSVAWQDRKKDDHGGRRGV